MANPAGLHEIATEAEMAALLNLSQRRIREWAARGVLQRVGAGRYDPAASIAAYCAALREVIDRPNRADPTLADEKAKLAQVDRQLKATRLAQLRDDVMSADEVAAAWAALAGTIRPALMALPAKAREALPELTAHDEQTLRRLVHTLLAEAARDAETVVVGGEGSLLAA